MFENLKIPNNLIPSDPRFGSGPSLIPVEFLESLKETGMHYLGTSHRKDGVKSVVKELQDGLRSYFDIPKDYEVVLGNGGATFLFDMIGLGLVKERSAHFTTGEFSSKWQKAHDHIPWVETETFNVDYGKGINPKLVEGSDMICCTLNETSTGVIVTKLPEMNDDTLLAVDATSGGGQVPCDISKTDLFFFSPQKVFASDGGFFVCVMSPKAINRVAEVQKLEGYAPVIMDWDLAIDNSRKNQTYNTPALATIFFLNEQVKLMNKLGYKEVCELAQEKADFIYAWAEEKPYLEAFVQDKEFRSQAVATINVDEKYPVSDLTKVLRDQKIVYDIDGYRKLGKNQIRISLFHNVKLEDLKKLTKIIDLAVKSV